MESQKIFLTRYSAAPNRINLGTYGSYGNEVLKFTFGDGWEGASAVAVFNSNLENPTPVLVGADGICKVPPESTQAPTNDGKITIEGYKDSARIISLDISFTVSNRSKSLTDVAPDPSEDIIEQILLASQNAVNVANEAKEIASKSYEDSKVNADAAAESAEDAKQSAKTAKENADIAVAAKGEVDSAKQQALTEISDSKTTALKAIGNAETGAVNAVTELQTAAIAQIEASKQDALSGISTSKDSAIDTIQSTQTTAVEQISSLSQTAKSEISDLKTQSLNEIQNKTAESVQSLTDAQENAIQAVEGAQSTGVSAVQGAQSTAETAISEAKTGALENIATEKEASVKAVNEAGSTATGAIADAKADALSEIETAKTGAVEAVTAEGDKQAERVQAIFPAVTVDDDGKVPIVQNGAWTLGEVAQDAYTRAESDARYAPIESAIRPTANGNPAVCENSIAWNFQGLKVYGKSTQVSNQLLPLTQPTYTSGGLTGTVQGDGSIIVNGTPESDVVNVFYIPLTLSPGTYYISGGEKVSGAVVAFVSVTSSSGTAYYANQSFTVSGNETSIVVMLQSADTQPINNYRVEVMLNAGSSPLPLQSYTPTPESPVPIVSAGDSGSVELRVTGANLFDYSKLIKNRVYNAAGELDASTGYMSTEKISVVPGTVYRVNANNANVPATIWVQWDKDDNILSRESSKPGNYAQALLNDTAYLGVTFYSELNAEWLENAVISLGENEIDFVPYQGSQSLLFSTPSGLPGLPVTSGGNYTDASGQQLASDCWDFGDGQQHILCGEIASYNGEEITTPYISSTGALTTGAQVLYVLPAPRTEPIPAEIMAAYRALTTYNGTTVVSTAEPVAGIEARYVAEPQKYIDKQVEAAVSKAITAAVKLSGGNA